MPASTPRADPPAWAIGAAGLLSLAVAMGIGRFAFTPLLPLMVQAGQIDVAGGSWLAAANYAGYLLGAVTVARMGWSPVRLAVVALLATALLTAAMAFEGPAGWWPLLRLLAGVASAWAFVATSVWCLTALARQGPSAWSSVFYAGVGAGIALAGLYCLFGAALGMAAGSLWLQLGGLALLLVGPVLWVLAQLAPLPVAARAGPASSVGLPPGCRGLVLSYALFGFGYILPATFLPVMARSVVEDPLSFGLAWPAFGLTGAASAFVAAALLRRVSRLQVWALSHALMGIGVLLPSLWRNGWTIGLSALLVGGTFMVVTLAGVQEIRARAPGAATALVSRMTAAFAAGQIAGPVASALLLQLSPVHGLDLALQAGAAALLASAVWLWRRA